MPKDQKSAFIFKVILRFQIPANPLRYLTNSDMPIPCICSYRRAACCATQIHSKPYSRLIRGEVLEDEVMFLDIYISFNELL